MIDRAFLSDLFTYVASFALGVWALGVLCVCVEYGIRGKVPYGEMKALGGLFFISAALFCLSEAFGAPGRVVYLAPRAPDPLAPFISSFWACANLAACIALVKVVDAFEHPERGWGRGWRHVAAAGEVLRGYAAGKAAVREERRTRANWHACARVSGNE